MFFFNECLKNIVNGNYVAICEFSIKIDSLPEKKP